MKKIKLSVNILLPTTVYLGGILHDDGYFEINCAEEVPWTAINSQFVIENMTQDDWDHLQNIINDNNYEELE